MRMLNCIPAYNNYFNDKMRMTEELNQKLKERGLPPLRDELPERKKGAKYWIALMPIINGLIIEIGTGYLSNRLYQTEVRLRSYLPAKSVIHIYHELLKEIYIKKNMTTDQIKAKIAKKEAKIAELKMQLAGAALQNLGKAIADHLKNQPQPKERESGGYVQKVDVFSESGKVPDNERVINRVRANPFPPTVELLEKNHNSLHKWTKEKVKSIEDRLDKIEMVMPHIEWTLEDVEGVDAVKPKEFLYTNSTGSVKSCKTDQCNKF